MLNMQTGLRPHHRWHLTTCFIFATMIVSLLAACGTPNAGSQQTLTPTSTQKTSTQALAHLTVFATADSGILRALKADTGQLRWQGQTGQLAGGKPVVENGIVYAGSFNTVYAFKASDGTLLWGAPGYNPPTGPLVADGKVFVDYYTNESDGSVTISVAALKGTDGSQLWSKQVVTHSTLVPPTPGTFGQLAANGTLYIVVLSALATNTQPAQFLLYAYGESDGKLLWRSSGTFTQGENASMLVENGVVFVYVDRLFAYKASNGSLLWQSQGASQPLSRPDGRYDLQVNQGTVYVATNDGLTAYHTDNGAQLWHIPVGSVLNQFMEIILTNGVIYASQGNGASALDASTGKQFWHYQAGDRAVGFVAPLTSSDTLYISNFMSGLVALDIHSGNLRWQAQVGGNGIRPILVDGTLFVGDGEGVITALSTSDGKILWRFPTNCGMSFPSALTVA